MRSRKSLRSARFIAVFVVAGSMVSHAADDGTTKTEAQQPATNAGRNTPLRGGKTLTPRKQSNSRQDLELTRRIRQAIVKDSSLSTNAHNVRIITVNGVVTLRGPVANSEEKASVAAKAQDVAGVKTVDNQLEISSHSKEKQP